MKNNYNNRLRNMQYVTIFTLADISLFSRQDLEVTKVQFPN